MLPLADIYRFHSSCFTIGNNIIGPCKQWHFIAVIGR
ncbi:unnamed protein product, partial [Allacma fusca]